MRSLKEFYVNEMKHNPEKIEKASWYLAELAIDSAMEIDMHRIGKSDDFSNTLEFAEILEKYAPHNSKEGLIDTTFPYTKLCFDFSYIPLWKGFQKESQKSITHFDELGLEMKLFSSELKDIQNLDANRRDKSMYALIDLSKEFSRARHDTSYVERLFA